MHNGQPDHVAMFTTPSGSTDGALTAGSESDIVLKLNPNEKRDTSCKKVPVSS